MPSPIGHALAGCAVVWGADIVDRRPSSVRLTATCAVLATLPDLDLLAPRYHRTATHSITAMFLVLIIAAAVTGKVTRWRTAVLCAAAYGSHLLLDWMGADRFGSEGIQLLWPVSDHFFISGWDVFDETERRHLLSKATMMVNIRAVVKEIALLTPVAAGLWLIRVKTAARFPSKLTGRHHPTQ